MIKTAIGMLKKVFIKPPEMEEDTDQLAKVVFTFDKSGDSQVYLWWPDNEATTADALALITCSISHGAYLPAITEIIHSNTDDTPEGQVFWDRYKQSLAELIKSKAGFDDDPMVGPQDAFGIGKDKEFPDSE